MEHRWYKRESSDMDVDIYKLGNCLGRAKVIDISSGGLGLSCDLDLQVNDILEITLPESHSARYLVIHAGENRCGLMFITFLD